MKCEEVVVVANMVVMVLVIFAVMVMVVHEVIVVGGLINAVTNRYKENIFAVFFKQPTGSFNDSITRLTLDFVQGLSMIH